MKNIVLGNGYSSDDITSAFNIAVKREIAKYQQKGLPIACYDDTNRQAYLEFPDGRREYITA